MMQKSPYGTNSECVINIHILGVIVALVTSEIYTIHIFTTHAFGGTPVFIGRETSYVKVAVVVPQIQLIYRQ